MIFRLTEILPRLADNTREAAPPDLEHISLEKKEVILGVLKFIFKFYDILVLFWLNTTKFRRKCSRLLVICKYCIIYNKHFI